MIALSTRAAAFSLPTEKCQYDIMNITMPRIQAIQTVYDPLLLPWLELYETAFPFNERVLIAHILNGLQPFNHRENMRYLALLDDADQFAGLIMFHVYPPSDCAVLYYLATRPECRGQGLGAAFYQQTLSDLFREVSLLVFEVEKPELAENDHRRQLAERRIRFYQRQGAQLLLGINYLQNIGSHCPPTPMHLMFQSRPGVSMETDSAFKQVAPIFKDDIQQTGTLAWSE
jgi:ribosomal protein S18 acetylase RimI-like enzyme